MDDAEQFPESRNNAQVSENKPSEYHVVLPCEVKDFRNFVSGLLGKPQELTGSIEGTFQISHREIANICHLITQRINNQNDSSLVHLGITVHYSDGTTVTHHNVKDFEAYHPTSPCFPVGVSIDFTYLIKFQNREIPEKQEISVAIETDPELAHVRTKRWFRRGLFAYRIQHTERTWASDISGLLKSHAETIIKKKSPFIEFISNNEDEFTTYLGLLVFAIVVIIWCKSTLLLLDAPQDFFEHYTDASISKYWVLSATVFSVLAIVLYSIRHFFQYHITLNNFSLIILTDKDIERQKKYNSRYIRRWMIYILGWSMSIVSGVVTTIITNNILS